MKHITYIILFISSFSFAEFHNPALVDFANSGDNQSKFTIEDCKEADKKPPLGFVYGRVNSSSEKIKVYYQHIISNPQNPTLIYLEGGPGGHSIGESEYFKELSSIFNILYLDPRGFGCGFLGESYANYASSPRTP